jgi:hypothetical protein
LCDISGFHREVTDVSGHRIGLIFKGQETKKLLGFLTHEEGTDMLSRNIDKEL